MELELELYSFVVKCMDKELKATFHSHIASWKECSKSLGSPFSSFDCRFFISHVEGGDLNSFGLIWVFAGFTCTARDQLVDGLSFVGDLANSSGSHFGFYTYLLLRYLP
ncbi:hypothetical protein GOBAR_DD31980 [Gossypium barbadense]|nr:hypothetical protein GOBAR_DD31980 [Gossypium barbadense]